MSRVLVFISKMLINHLPVDSLLTDIMLYGQGGGVLIDYIRQPCKGQGFFVPVWSVNGCKFPPL